jgi:DNA-binding NarL/FixJ family response regulator
MCLPGNKCRLLFLEDEQIVIDSVLAENQLGNADYALDITVARTLYEAKEILRYAARPFDVISIDPHLPDSDGIRTYEAIQAVAPDPPKFIYTGNVDSNFIDIVIRHGAERVIMKGEWSPSQYLTVLHYGAGQHRARGRLKAERSHYKEKSEELARELSAIRDGIPQSEASQALEKIIGDLDNRLAAAG